MTYRRNNSITDPSKVHLLLRELALTGPLSIERVASNLGTSPRTLQRRLSDAQLTFRTAVNRARLETAEALLRETALPIRSISDRLGYGNPTSFTRAFSRWTGRSPRAFRRIKKDDAQG